MADRKDPTLIEYENLIEQLMKENERLKDRISELEEENRFLKHTNYAFQESEPSAVKKEPKIPLKFPRKIKIKDEIDSPEPLENLSAEIPLDLDSPVPTLSSANKPIIEGYSRRQCPHCDNDRQMYIQEEIDKTNIILDYPRIYGKKYKCGRCGGYWKISPTLE
ncbi:MAG: hypothetical protein ACFE8B_04300 [Candidatus Hermodarchaeota archaeon]